jgi:hypothetical protein
MDKNTCISRPYCTMCCLLLPVRLRGGGGGAAGGHAAVSVLQPQRRLLEFWRGPNIAIIILQRGRRFSIPDWTILYRTGREPELVQVRFPSSVESFP